VKSVELRPFLCYMLSFYAINPEALDAVWFELHV